GVAAGSGEERSALERLRFAPAPASREVHGCVRRDGQEPRPRARDATETLTLSCDAEEDLLHDVARVLRRAGAPERETVDGARGQEVELLESLRVARRDPLEEAEERVEAGPGLVARDPVLAERVIHWNGHGHRENRRARPPALSARYEDFFFP